ncbi:uncharacterized protein LOC122952227 [Acropora millepora]|nr:uncharacterized protein LOC122952227 [Acropora millepora]
MGTNIHCECGRKNILSSILIMEVMEVIESEEEFNISVGHLSEEGQVGVNTYGSPIAAQERAQDFVRGGEVLAATDENVRVDFVTKLSTDEKDQLLIRLLSQGRGSLEFATNMLTGRSDLYQDPLSPEGAGNNPGAWCVCGVCREMPDEQENVCCRKKTCVTSYVMFKTVCLDREVLQLAIRARCDIRAEEPDYSTQSYRKAAYRQFTLWKYGKLGRGNR